MSAITTLPPPQRIGRRDLIALAVLVLAAIGIPLWLATAAGAIGLPSNDDWVYMRAASNLYLDGVIDVPGHSAAFVGQLAMVQPFLGLSGGDPWAFHAFSLTMAGIGVTATYLLARRFVGLASAVFVVLLILVFPGFARESLSFMTDVPAYAFGMLCLLLGIRWLQGQGGAAVLIAALLAGLVAVSIREFMIAAPAAILIAGLANRRGRDRIGLGGLSVILAVGVVGILLISGSVSGHGGPSSVRFLGLIDIPPAFATFAAVLLPATILYVGPRARNFSAAVVILAAALVCVVIVDPDGPILGNLWTAHGLAANQILTGYRAPLLGPTAWAFSTQLALFAAILAATVALTWVQTRIARVSPPPTGWAVAMSIATSREAPLVIFLVGYAGELVLYSFVGGLFDRYLYPMIPVAAILLLRWTSQPFGTGRSHALAHLTLAWLVISAFLVAANSFAYDAARYRGGEAAVAMGYDAETVDAGYEWVGMHGSGMKTVFDPTGLNWWQDLWASFRSCAVLSNSPIELDDYRLIWVNTSAYRQFVLFGPDQPLFLYGALNGECPTAAPEVDAPQSAVGAAHTLAQASGRVIMREGHAR